MTVHKIPQIGPEQISLSAVFTCPRCDHRQTVEIGRFDFAIDNRFISNRVVLDLECNGCHSFIEHTIMTV